MAVQSFGVNGMTCGHCVHAVTEELTGLAGVRSVDVALVAGGTSTVTVDAATEIADAEIAAALDEAGAYTLASV
jgi:copper chaperone CopZ